MVEEGWVGHDVKLSSSSQVVRKRQQVDQHQTEQHPVFRRKSQRKGRTSRSYSTARQEMCDLKDASSPRSLRLALDLLLYVPR